ncbi:MAG: Dihydrolipoyl dehydrogenase [Alphaproteobacteria bacterium MarineAlpha3_Bin6]|nr:MAG: Dihydrolipoyl dehydrogenase [Alphaproteobacteria bacterium MarineAlpha3_Bin6]
MKPKHYDVLIIGGGPGGISAASKLVLQGKNVLIINDGPLMGYGIEGAFKSKAGYELTREYLHVKYREDVFGPLPALNFSRLKNGIEQSAASLTSMLENRLQRLKVKLIRGQATFKDPHNIIVGKKEFSGEHIIIATGTRPRILPNMTIDGKTIITSDEAINLTNSPKSILILGAGVIGCEFASIFNAVGTEVHLVDSKDHIMSNEDPDVREFLKNAFDAMGINVIPSSRYQTHDPCDDGIRTILSTGEIMTEMVMLAVGRIPSSKNLNLEATGVKVDDRNYIEIDENACTNVPHIFAVGDIGNRNVPSDLSLVHVAEAEGRCAAAKILDIEYPQGLDHIPYIVFTHPMLAGAGVTEEYVRKKHGDVRVGKYPYARNHRAHAIQPPIGFVKLIVGPSGDDRILGVRAVGPHADAIVGAAAIMIERKLPYTYILESIFPHPSLLECLKGSAQIIAGDLLQYEEGEELTIAQALGEKSRE